MYPVLKPLLNKGGAGRSLSRGETIDVLIPLVEQHIDLLSQYNAVRRALRNTEIAERLNDLLPRFRNEVGKIRETILALGGVAPTGAGEPLLDLEGSDGNLLYGLDQKERALRDALKEAIDYPHHQFQTLAVLKNNLEGSESRISVLRPLADRNPRTQS